MPTLRDADARAAITARLRTMTPRTERRWGAFTGPTMICHLSDSYRVALGEVRCVRRDTLFTRTLGKWIVVDSALKPPPGRIGTAPEMLRTRPGVWEDDLATCLRLIDRIGAESPTGVHPTFGPLTPAEWGRMTWKHTDHHLRQFGA